MPWKEWEVVDQRYEFVKRVMEPGVVFLEECEAYGISAKTGYKWVARYEEHGKNGLRDLSRRPIQSPRAVDEETICRLVGLKLAHRSWGPKKIHALHEKTGQQPVSLSTVKRVLKKVGLVEERRVRRQTDTGRLVNPRPATEPNDVWTVDFKGWWRTINGRCEPLTLRDAHSRYVLRAEALRRNGWKEVQSAFRSAFAEYGLPRVLQSDNGSPFACTRALMGLTQLSAWWLALGIDLHRSRPGHPQDNGAHERMHLDIRREIEGLVHGSLEEGQAAMDLWRKSFNQERPHEALGMKRPADIYKPSARRLEKEPEEMEYPRGWLRRKVNESGVMVVERRKFYVSSALKGWHVGLKYMDAHRFELWFARTRLATVDMDTVSIHPADPTNGIGRLETDVLPMS